MYSNSPTNEYTGCFQLSQKQSYKGILVHISLHTGTFISVEWILKSQNIKFQYLVKQYLYFFLFPYILSDHFFQKVAAIHSLSSNV